MLPGVEDSEPDASESDSDSITEMDGTSDGSGSEASAEAEQLTYVVDSLFRLLPALEEALADIVARKLQARTLLRTGTSTEIYSTIIRDKYPRADATLALRLAQGVVDTSQRLDLFSDVKDRQPVQSTVLKPSLSQPSLYSGPFLDSGLGTSLGTSLGFSQSSVAESVISDLSDLMTITAVNPNYRRLCLPSMPKEGEDCPICLQKPWIRNKKQWR
jgi:hypothetical protein